MADAPAAARFVHALAALVLREGDAAARAQVARAALDDVFAGQKSLVLDVQFTGFAQKGALVGGVDSVLLRAAGHLITLRVARIGFTPAIDAEELRAVGELLAKNGGELGEGGIVGAMRTIAPRGVYLSTAGGDVYKPAPRATEAAPAADPSPEVEAAAPAPSVEPPAAAGETPPPPVAPVSGSSATAWDDEVESTELAEFEILESFEPVSHAAAESVPMGAAPDAPGGGREEVPSSDMYHFFRATGTGTDEAAEALPRLLHQAENVTRFDELAESAARTALALVRSDAHAQAVELLDALVREAERPDRNRFFRESAVQSLRRAGTADTLHRLVELLPYHQGTERERILRFFVFMGADALLMLEGLLYRSQDAELRGAVFRALLSVEGRADKLIANAVQDPGPVKTRLLLELAGQAGVNPEVARRWAAEAAAHRDPVVRVEAARSAAALGGRGAMRVLVDLLGDGERLVRREAIHGLGTLGDAAAVPFLARLLGDSDEELQCMAAAALGRIGSPEGLPPLLGVVNKRSLLQLKKSTRPKLAALNAISRIRTPAAHDALQSVASGRDELAEEAKRLLASL